MLTEADNQIQRQARTLLTEQDKLIAEIRDLTKAIKAQTEAINFLAASNELMAHTVLDTLTESTGDEAAGDLQQLESLDQRTTL